MTQILATNSFPLPALHRQRYQQGFTLLELLVVSFLIMLVIGITVPNLTSTDNSAFVAQVRRAVATLSYARRLAVVEASPQTAVFFQLDPESPDYATRQALVQASDVEARWVSELLSIRYQKDPNLPAESVEQIEVTFFPQGGSTGGIINFIMDKRSARIRIDPITGRIATAFDEEAFDDAF